MSWLKKILKKDEKEAKQESQTATVKPAKVEVQKEKPAEKRAVKKELPLDSIAYRVLLKPVITEKSATSESAGKYSFVVASWANKTQVKQAIQDLYGVKPARVNIINTDGRVLSSRRAPGRRSDYKKAIATLPQGATINIHSGV